jgi:hypothetical protein
LYGAVWWIFENFCCNFGAPARATVIRQDIAVRDVSNLIWGFDSWEPMGSCLNLLFPWAKPHFLVQTAGLLFLKLYGNRMRNFQWPSFPHNFAPKISPEPKYVLYGRVSTSATICDKN